MEILRLDKNSYLPDELIEDYSSMIWAERKLEAGSFEMKTSMVGSTKNLLPEGSLISHVDTAEVMVVETHEIARDDSNGVELMLKGRTLETFAENRHLLPAVYGEEWPSRVYTSADLSLMLLWNFLANATGQDAARAGKTLDVRNQIPNLVISDSTSISEVAKTWMLSEGELYAKLVEFLTVGKLGIRMIRPSRTSGRVVSVNVTDDHGRVDRVEDLNIDQMRIDVYTGADRTLNQPFLEPVVFQYDSGHIESPSYIFSIKDLKNLAVVSTTSDPVDVWAETGLTPPSSPPTGLDLRILHVDGGNYVDIPYEEFIVSVQQKAEIELAKHNRAVIFDGAISPWSPYKYNQDYFLGDKITLAAEYGFEASMEIVEYVRTEDQSGDRGYPTLVLAE